MVEPESLRKKFRPERIRVLFVGESPPASGRFFYAANSRLYAATVEAFTRFVPDLCAGDFLQNFKSLGCFLVDLLDEPINHLQTLRRLEMRILGVRALVGWLKSLPDDQPTAAIAVMKEIKPYVREALDLADRRRVRLDEVPFPYDDDVSQSYADSLGKLLVTMSRNNVLVRQG